jgi:hypothetical protein
MSSNRRVKGTIMHLRFLGTNSEQGTCPAIYETDHGTFAVQGRLVVDPEALADCVNRGSDEVVVEIPKALVRFFDPEQGVGAADRT